MKAMQSNQARKRAVNLTLNEDLVSQAKGMTGNLSGVVEQLLADYVLKLPIPRDSATQSTVILPLIPR